MWYKNYLRSDHWQHTRKEKLHEAGYRCEACGSSRRLEVHHLTYDTLSHESSEDLRIYCRKCHFWRHAIEAKCKHCRKLLAPYITADDAERFENLGYEMPKFYPYCLELEFLQGYL